MNSNVMVAVGLAISVVFYVTLCSLLTYIGYKEQHTLVSTLIELIKQRMDDEEGIEDDSQ